MTEAEQIVLNGDIAIRLFGWTTNPEGTYTDPTGDVYQLPPNYTDNSGLAVGIEYKLRGRGWTLATLWVPGSEFGYTIQKGTAVFNGLADTRAMALCLALQQAFAAGVAMGK